MDSVVNLTVRVKYREYQIFYILFYCNLSERIEEKAIQKGEILQLVSLVKKGILSLEIALQEVAEENRTQFLEILQKKY